MYVELHARSAFSFLEGAALPEQLIELCAEHGMPAMALLDRDGVYGAPRFHLAATKISERCQVRAHVGAEVTSTEVASTEVTSPEVASLELTANRPWRYPVLAASREGYQNLCRLITQMKLRAKKGEGGIALEEMAARGKGLICLTGGDEGPLAHALAQGGEEAALESIKKLCRAFGRDNVYVELQRHLRREEEWRNQAAVRIARKLKLPLLATNGVCHALPQQRELLDVFTCIRHHRTLATAGRLLSRNSERHFKTHAEMSRLFADLPEAIANTQELSSRLQFTLSDLGYQFPIYPTPAGETQISFLRKRTQEGMLWRYGASNERARLQIERELALIEKLELEGYFLIVWDIVRFCGEKNILVQGRGSAANSAVCYALGITAVDPVGMDLLFERFLSEERGEWPDIDLDLPSGDQRERAIQYVYERYGKLGAAMTANVITYRGKSAAREIGKALSFDPETLDRLSKLVGAWEYRDPSDSLARQFRDAGLRLEDPRIRKFFELCQAVQDLPRHLGQHSGGMVVCQGQLDSVVPLEPASMPGRVVVQWDKEDCADMGIVKVDLLGLGMMAVLEESLQIIAKHHEEEIDLGRLPANDAAVYGALQKADTVGMFQIESRAQMACLPRLHPTCFYDIVVQVAIIRPGPIVGKMVNPYLKRRQGLEPPECLHPSLEPVLARTLGVPLFQEQLLRMAMIAAGFTGGHAEELRRALGFKRSEQRMKQVEISLRSGMRAKGIAEETQEKIVQSITSFALYGFPESHAASFALLAYASAYLKCNYLAAFTTAMLNSQPMGFYSPATLVKDAQRHGARFKPIDLTRSDWNCTLEAIPAREGEIGETAGAADEAKHSDAAKRGGFAVRLGMRYVKGLRKEIGIEIERQRAMGRFASIEDLKRRVPGIQKSELTALAETGALNFISAKRSSHRRDALWQVERAARRPGPLLEAGAEEENREENEDDRASEIITAATESNAGCQSKNNSKSGSKRDSKDAPKSDSQNNAQNISPLRPMDADERLAADFRGTGLTVGPHPMAYQRAELKKQGIHTAAELLKLPHGTHVRYAGAVIARQRPGTAKGFVFLSLEDETGIANAIITPQLFESDHTVVVHHSFLLIVGTLQNQQNVVSIKAESVQPLAVTRTPRAEIASHDFH
jgi:error-prone DNA polymerase